ncbi:hypothetical protein NMY22_g1803 [Coprinellus aureogranulatus]|nr:hypothetical protein NMY22_g1803 [Coprinellus aureogranulatus]
MVRFTFLATVLALVPALVLGQTTTPPPLNTNTGAGAKTSTSTTIKLTPSGSTTTTSGITAFTGGGGSVSRYPVRVTSNGVVYISTATITLIPATNRPSVTGFNDTDCGSCWRISYAGTGRSVPITIINSAPTGFTLCTDTLLALTGFNRDNVPDNIPVSVVQAPASECGQ